MDFGPRPADYRNAWSYAVSQDTGHFKACRQLAMQYLEGKMEPPQGCTLGDTVHALMLRAADNGDVTAHWYIGLWHLERGEGGGPVLPVDEGETYATMAIAWLEAGRRLCDHGTILRTEEALNRLAGIYEFGIGNIPINHAAARSVYAQMISERFWPENEAYRRAYDRMSRNL